MQREASGLLADFCSTLAEVRYGPADASRIKLRFVDDVSGAPDAIAANDPSRNFVEDIPRTVTK